jgi:hypothetical protein
MELPSEEEDWVQEQGINYGGLIVFDGFNDCIIGVSDCISGEVRFIYDFDSVIEKIMADSGMTLDDALDYFHYNFDAGSNQPIFAQMRNHKSL